MRVAALTIASCLLAASGAGAAFAQYVDPLRVLESSRRDRLEMDQRLAREAAARRQKEKADQAAQANAQRKLEKENAAAASGAPTPGAAPARLEASSAREIGPEASAPASSTASAASGTPDQTPPGAPPDRDILAGTAPSRSLAMDTAGGTPPSDQTAVASVPENASGAPLPIASAAGVVTESPAANQPLAATPDPVFGGTPIAPPPRVLITVDKAAQRMRVTVDGKLRHLWPVSTGRARYETPTGTFRPLYLARMHRSKEWDDAPMPHSIFFTGQGHAIHASTATRWLGRRASHGCVRLAPAKAAALFALVQAEGPSATQVTITNGASAKVARPRTVEARTRKLHAQTAVVP